LSKTYLKGEAGRDRLALSPEQFYLEHEVDRRTANPVQQLDVAQKSLTLKDGSVVAFDKALLATGSRSRMLPIPGADLAGVATLRTIDDVDRIRAAVKNGGTWVVIGAGYIGLEVAAVLRALGLEVHVLEAADRVMSRTSGETISRFFEGVHRKHGVAIELNAAVRAISKSENGKFTVETDAGPCHADGVLVGIGGQPNVELAEAAGLDVANGIVVDDLCRTSAEGILAAGDCTIFPSARYGRDIRLESVQNAIDQAKAAALSMLGQGKPYDPVPWFWSDQYDVKYQIAGLCTGADKEIVRGDPASGAFSVAYLQAGRLIALDAINRPRDYMFARRLVPTPSPVDETVLSDPDRDLKDAVAAS
ncbi:MAG: NAD(P)/FAD-dependent oxidoreductase, partial [Hyphomicrobiaceae bacterium]